MHEVIVCEKPTSAEKIAKALSPSAKKKVYNKKVNKGAERKWQERCGAKGKCGKECSIRFLLM